MQGKFTDLSWLEGKTCLEMLHLGTIPVRDDDLIHLRPLAKLCTLVLRSPHITDAGLIHLSGLVHLQCLIFAHDSIHGEGLVHLGRMRSLDALAMLRSKIETLDHLPAIPIRSLCLPFSSIDDRGLNRLRSMPALNQVFLDGTKITDAGLASLVTQPKLESVQSYGTRVTPSARQPSVPRNRKPWSASARFKDLRISLSSEAPRRDQVAGAFLRTNSSKTTFLSKCGGSSPCARTKSWKVLGLNRPPMAFSTSARSSRKRV